MEIRLHYAYAETCSCPEGWTVVGAVGAGRLALAYDPERRPHLIGEGVPVPLDRAEVNAALAHAVDAAASRLWPGGWTVPFAQVFNVNRRSLLPDRLARQGLPPGVLRALGDMSSEPDPEGLGWMLMSLARYADAWGEHSNPNERIERAMQAASNASEWLKIARRTLPAWRPKDNEHDPSADTIP
ncbi:hypothetical protein ASG52_11800 [Methylobacterium sp. Leaf456]|uniref:hypothetical protein n=1 Tax=Methylobacterium sp. Leaf456 TaxID=1736382 RepID=UPI0006F9EB1A|nr:hypothetical protein [Methylobacterium sp. Leaf456]KQT46418.1 hypothetical protein ASG52_11800 [Methylobacterium sp. Leaf456]